jgi:hypothetical protein
MIPILQNSDFSARMAIIIGTKIQKESAAGNFRTLSILITYQIRD